MEIMLAELADAQVVALLEHHVAQAHANSPAGSTFVLDLDALRHPALTVWAAWDGATLLGLGALRALDAAHGEVKLMRTAPGQLRKGVAAAMLAHIVAQARARGYTRLSLETGDNAAFAPARAMYERAGFTPCGAFADYNVTEFNRCYTLVLD